MWCKALADTMSLATCVGKNALCIMAYTAAVQYKRSKPGGIPKADHSAPTDIIASDQSKLLNDKIDGDTSSTSSDSLSQTWPGAGKNAAAAAGYELDHACISMGPGCLQLHDAQGCNMVVIVRAAALCLQPGMMQKKWMAHDQMHKPCWR